MTTEERRFEHLCKQYDLVVSEQQRIQGLPDYELPLIDDEIALANYLPQYDAALLNHILETFPLDYRSFLHSARVRVLQMVFEDLMRLNAPLSSDALRVRLLKLYRAYAEVTRIPHSIVTAYWLSAPIHRGDLFKARLIPDRESVARTDGLALINLLKPGDNMAFLYLGLQHLDAFKPVDSSELWKKIATLLGVDIASKEHVSLFFHSYEESTQRVLGTVNFWYVHRQQCAWEAKFKDSHPFKLLPESILERERRSWMCCYLCLAHGCTAPIIYAMEANFDWTVL